MIAPPTLAITGGRVIDPASARDAVQDLYVADGRIVGVGEKPAGFVAETVIDARGLVVCPGLVDLSVRGVDVESELRAAVAGGITTACCPPDTTPALDEPGLAETLRQHAEDAGLARLLPIGALTVGLAGSRLADLRALAAAGCAAFSQGSRPLPGLRTLRHAMQYAATFDLPLWLQAEDPSLADGGVAHDGEVAARLGLPGIPASAESTALFALLELAAETGARLHLTRLSSERGVALVAAARGGGVKVSCDANIHALHFCDADIGNFDANARLTPPLRGAADRAALRRAVATGDVQAICSDHTPINADGKSLPFDEARPGATAVELLLPLALAWAEAEKLSLAAALAPLTHGPATIAGIERGIRRDAIADLCLFDPNARWTVGQDTLISRGKNTLALGAVVRGRVRHTLVGGFPVYTA